MGYELFLAPLVYAAISFACVANTARIIVRDGTGFYEDAFEMALTHFAAVAGIVITSEVFNG